MVRRAIVAALSLLTVTGCAVGAPPEVDRSPLTASDGRPSDVPADYIWLPAGWFHRSCLKFVRRDDHVQANGDIVHADGTTTVVGHCPYPHYDDAGNVLPENSPAPHASRVRVSGREQPNYIYADWLADFYIHPGTYVPSQGIRSGVTWYSFDMVVPPNPAHDDDQSVALWAGIEPDGNQEVFQPIIEFNAFSWDHQWSAYTEDCCHSGYPYLSVDVVHVAVGDTISGYVYRTGMDSYYMGMNSSYQGGFIAGLGSTTASDYGPMTYVYGGVLEVKNLNRCSNLPSNGYEYFNDQSVNVEGYAISLDAWNAEDRSDWWSLDPNCVANVGGSGTSGFISWYGAP